MIETFTQTFGDIDVTKMLNVLKRKDWTRKIATELECAQLKMWLNSKKSTDDVFKLLKLVKESNSFRDKPLFNTWISYMNFFTAENPDKKARIFSALEARFNGRPLNTILNAASNFPNMEDIATKILTGKIQSYMTSHKSPREVFKLLGIDDVGYHVLTTSVFQSWPHYVKDFNKRNPMHQESCSKFKAWSKYLNDFNKRYPDQKTTMLNGLRANYNDIALLGMLKAAKKDPYTEKLASNLQNALINKWLVDKEKPEDLYRMLDGVETSDELIK
ncbi:Hypothetical protein PHPALM_16173 [Phytophthora palmivora]|uniref:RxLR effector PexRD54 WY domain-containing protein n=1 Tax=Phytophthora palmivora TaxID=4796 RepID=A0A2P4XQC4_9STRA|nr:Hypothetical protein PHPALM_16173 [Phytophthora palmivora]